MIWVAKDSPRVTAGELQKIAESLVQKTVKKNCQTEPTSTHFVWEGYKKNSPSSFKNKLKHIQLSAKTGTLHGNGFYDQMKLKNELFSSKHSRWVWWTQREKSTPCVQWNILLYFWCCGPIFLLEVLDILFRHMASNTNR